MTEPQGKLILIVDDQAADQSVLTSGLRRLGVQNPVYCLQDGHETIRYFNGDPPFSDRAKYPLPSAMFLDLKLPGATGWEVLDWIQGFGKKEDCLIFVCTEFTHVAGMQRVYNLGADSFIKKPIQQVDLMNLIHHFPRPWTLEAG